jgi:hypothetical protein
MDSLDYTHEEALLKFHRDVLWWKSIIKYTETEILFINRLLNSKVFNVKQPNIFENLQKFKHQLKIETRLLNELKEIIEGHDNKMRGMIDCDDLSCDEAYLENHESLRIKFEKFFKIYSEYKSKIYNYTGSLLKH